MNYRPLPIKLQEFQKILKYLRNVLQCDLDDNLYIEVKNIRDHIINLDRNKQLSIYDITNKCIEFINNKYMNKIEEP